MDDEQAMLKAVELAESVRGNTSPNPWVGAVIDDGSQLYAGATAPPGGPHAEAEALARAGVRARGATMYVTLEPCSHTGRTPPCADALLGAGIKRVVVGMEDPDPKVRGAGLARLREGGIDVDVGVARDVVRSQLAPYLKHRRTGRPWVVLKLAASLDGRIAAPDGSSRWITGEQAREDAHRLRARTDAILVGAGTVRLDDPQLTVRAGRSGSGSPGPLRVVLGRVPPGAAVSPALELTGELAGVLDELGERGVMQLLVEGGARVAHDFHAAGLVDQYVIYLAPLLFGGDDGRPMFSGPGSKSIEDAWRGRITSVTRLGPDVRVDLGPRERFAGEGCRG